MNTKTIKFDLNKYKLYEKIKAKQGDTKSRFLLFQLLDGSIPFNLKNRSVRAYMIKPDGREIFNDLIVNNYNLGYCTLELTNQVLAAQGIVKIELMVTEGDKKLTSSVFELEVVKSINSEKSIVSTNEFTALLNGLAALSEYDNYKNSVKEMEINKANKAEVEEKFISVEEKIKNNSEQLEHKRIFKPNLYGNLNWSVSKKVDNIFPYTDETLNSWKGCIDGIIIDIQIKPNSETINDNTTYYLNPTIEWINYVVNKCKELNIVIKGVKFHADEIRTNVNNLTFVNWFNKYKELIRSVTNVLKCDYLLYFNESSSLLNREVTEINIINDFTNELKSLGFQVGFAGTGVKNLDKGYIFDIISFHQYPAISGKLNNTTYSDSVIAWEQNRNTYLVNKAIKDYPNKKIMLGEAGCPDSWECLAVPEKWDWNSNDLTPDMRGKPSAIFLYGMLETYKNTNLDCACFWYNDPMLKETQILLKKYL